MFFFFFTFFSSSFFWGGGGGGEQYGQQTNLLKMNLRKLFLLVCFCSCSADVFRISFGMWMIKNRSETSGKTEHYLFYMFIILSSIHLAGDTPDVGLAYGASCGKVWCMVHLL